VVKDPSPYFTSHTAVTLEKAPSHRRSKTNVEEVENVEAQHTAASGAKAE
jgi:hypothetical protein